MTALIKIRQSANEYEAVGDAEGDITKFIEILSRWSDLYHQTDAVNETQSDDLVKLLRSHPVMSIVGPNGSLNDLDVRALF